MKKRFNDAIDQCSPVQVDYNRIVNYDEEGNEFITYEEVDYPKLQQSNGLVGDWSLNSLLAAGINPDFPISTGFGTRIQGVDVVSEFATVAEQILSETENKE